jgi:hypothetical protein
MQNLKQKQTQEGFIKSYDELQKELWSKNSLSALAVLQSTVFPNQLLELIEEMLIAYSRRVVGFKRLKDLIEIAVNEKEIISIMDFLNSVLRPN